MIIDNVLDAYEETIYRKKSTVKNIAQLGKGFAILFVAVLVGAFVFLALALFFQTLLWFVFSLVYSLFLHVVIIIIDRRQRKIWDVNIKNYNEELDLIAEILKAPAFNLYSKLKLKQLIGKFQESIKEQKAEGEKKEKKTSGFLTTYILPTITFFAGKVGTENVEFAEWFALALVLIFAIFVGRLIISFIAEALTMIKGNHLEKQKYLCFRLQDLWDRDFLEKDDISEVKYFL